jgi:hypothetical protein
MGSFDVACSISRITINPGDPVAYFPLKLYDYAYDPRAANNTLIYTWCYYEPATLPIFGKYYDYGYIDQIEKDSSTKAIEKHFECPIETVVGAQGDIPCPGMFVHRDIYQAMIDNQVDEWGRPEATREKLYERYDTYRKAAKALRAIPKQKKGDEWSRRFDDTMEKYRAKEAIANIGFREFETFMKIYTPLINRGWLRTQMADLMCFLRSMNAVNAHFFPAACGYQCGNHYGNRIIQEKTMEILNNKIKEDEAERAEYE